MNIKTLLQEYPEYLRCIRDASNNTVNDYVRDVKRYINYFGNRVDPSLETFDINPKHLRNYLIYLRSLQNNEATIERRLHGLTSFWTYLHNQHDYSTPITLRNCGIRLRKKRKPTRPIPTENYTAILEIVGHELSKIK